MTRHRLIGFAVALLLYWILNKIAELLPSKWEERIKPYLFVGPAIAVLAVFLIYPLLQTIQFSFANANSTAYVGFQNYTQLLGNSAFRQTLLNTVLWMIIAPTVTVGGGLLFATLTDRLKPRGEKVAKTLLFLPMAILGVLAAHPTLSHAPNRLRA